MLNVKHSIEAPPTVSTWQTTNFSVISLILLFTQNKINNAKYCASYDLYLEAVTDIIESGFSLLV